VSVGVTPSPLSLLSCPTTCWQWLLRGAVPCVRNDPVIRPRVQGVIGYLLHSRCELSRRASAGFQCVGAGGVVLRGGSHFVR
jgi:hypothetical protein